MTVTNNRRIEELEQWSPILFYITGTLFVLSLLNIVALLNGMDLRLHPYINFVAIGHIIAIVGVLSFYPKLSVKAPGISLVGTIFLGIAAICFFINQIVMIGNNLFQLPGFIIPTYIIWVNYISYIAGFLLFGVASLRTDLFSNLLGFALLTLMALNTFIVILYILRGLGNIPTWVTLVIVGSQALVYFAMGYILKNEYDFAKAGMGVV